MPLNDTQCRNAKPKERAYKLTDDKGLYLEVKPTGVKAWRYRFELNGKESTFAIGQYGPAPAGETKEQAEARRKGGLLTLAEAREERVKARGLVIQGINPSHQRQHERIKQAYESAVTFESVADEWLALQEWEDVTKARRLDMLKRIVFPTIGKLPIRSVSPAHVLNVIQQAAKNNGPSVAAEAKRTMAAIFARAVSTLRVDTDPTYSVRGALPKNKTQHRRPLKSAEIGQLLRDLDGYRGAVTTKAAFGLMWGTLCRPSEAVEAEWSEFDLDSGLWTIPERRMKARREHITPLPAQTVDLLRGVHAVTGRGKFVFPNRDDRDKPMTLPALRQALKTLGWAGKYSPHATRATGSTMLNELHYEPDLIEAQLAHADRDKTRGSYNQAKWLPKRMMMMQRWVDLLDSLRKGENVLVGTFDRSAA
jgi:integrase